MASTIWSWLRRWGAHVLIPPNLCVFHFPLFRFRVILSDETTCSLARIPSFYTLLHLYSFNLFTPLLCRCLRVPIKTPYPSKHVKTQDSGLRPSHPTHPHAPNARNHSAVSTAAPPPHQSSQTSPWSYLTRAHSSTSSSVRARIPSRLLTRNVPTGLCFSIISTHILK